MDAAVTRKCGTSACDNANSCASDTERTPSPSAAKRAKAKTPRPRRAHLQDADPVVTAPVPAIEAAPVVDTAPTATTAQSVKTGLGEIHWQKRDAGILDGRESLFLKVWNALSSFQMPKAPLRPKAPKKRPETEIDPFADLFD
ncbi:hypothetical protein CU669_04875 [Paramagnetospirillum kuznetsovii]|uniref:Uncharacterized protein n=1 Tax=Paramagnetospirillum kuznetsovii TaxID=2053833 RepID=A0A364P2S8_9PROT|nr:hypothetical protein [Paramagnetospirillum kuznetsovii]RAU23457.1 hypothetical protein CU669_04875 [Paramagnetospirillum kuznetsovii]